MIIKRKTKGVQPVHPLILEKRAFKMLGELGHDYRGKLYKKCNEYFMPAKHGNTLKKWFLYPEGYLPELNREYIVNVMLHALTETLNDVLFDLQVQKAKITEATPIINQMIESYEKQPIEG